MKRILLLGGSSQQIIAIETAKKLGYYTILCDYLVDNPGQKYADKFYLASTTDKDLIFDIAKKEKINGILAYASDPAAPTAAYVAQQLNLPGNPYESVVVLCNKDKFRVFLKENGFNSPMAKGYHRVEDAINDLKNGFFQFPVIIKPVDSSGSKGVSVLQSAKNFESVLISAMSFSRSKNIIVEEYIEKSHPYLIGGDIFICNGKVVLWGLMNCHRNMEINPLVPIGKSYPIFLDENDLDNVKSVLQSLVEKLHIQFGSMNVELIVDANHNVYPIDIGPRAGGNMIPDLLGMIFDCNVVEMAVKTAMGETPEICTKKPDGCFATLNLHSDINGVFEKIDFSSEIERFIIRKNIYKSKGDKIECFSDASKALGVIFLKFENKDTMNTYLPFINKYIKVISR